MEFKEEFKKLVAKIMQNKAYITNEETTKLSLIVPFINMLGYDTSNPLEVRSEYSAGFDKIREKVDYAILKNGKIIILIEAKPVNDLLKNYDPQLSKYFNSTPEVKFAVLTNGIRYKFYSDLSQPNIMDLSPFFELDFENVKHNDIETLQRFSNESFDVSNLVSYAEELVFYSKLMPEIISLLRDPSDEFIRLLIRKHLTDVKLSTNVIERFRGVVRTAITDALLEMFRQGIMQNDIHFSEQPSNEPNPVKPIDPVITSEQPLPNPVKISLPSMKKLFEWGLIKKGDCVYLKNHVDEKANVIDDKYVNYNGKVLSFNQWGQQVTGWKSICIYDRIIVEGQTETLGVSRRNKMSEK